MKSLVLNKLDWQKLLNLVANYSQSEEGKNRCLNLQANLTKEDITKRWEMVSSLSKMINIGYCPQVGDVKPVSHLLKAINLGKSLEGKDFLDIAYLLEITHRVYKFSFDLAARCEVLNSVSKNIFPLPKLLSRILDSIDDDGNVKDSASLVLQKIRKRKSLCKKDIEIKLKQMIHDDSTINQYLQDQYFTVRLDRYVLPIRLDGRGRVAGNVIETSASEQTLFIEPKEIQGFNDTIQDLILSEKIEIIKIFRDISQMIKASTQQLQNNYEELINLDFYTAQALFSIKTNSNKVNIVDYPSINLNKAHHPLISYEDLKSSVPNKIELKRDQKSLIISGPNAGGKTVVLKTLGLLQLMVASGLMVPCDEHSEIYLFENIHIELGDAQNLSANLSSFSGHIQGVKSILDNVSERDLILFDELAIGTEPHTGSAIAQAILEEISKKGAKSVVTTHYESLKHLAYSDSSYRNGSMEYSLDQRKPTYHLILDVPGQSYGIELISKMGLSESVIKRAKKLKGENNEQVEKMLQSLSVARDTLRVQEQSYKDKQKDIQIKNEELSLQLSDFKKSKGELIQNLLKKYEKKLIGIYEDFSSMKGEYKKLVKKFESGAIFDREKTLQNISKAKDKTKEYMDLLNQEMLNIESSHIDKNAQNLPGVEVKFEDVFVGRNVYVISLKKEGVVVKLGTSSKDKIEVSVAKMRIKVALDGLRITSKAQKPRKQEIGKKKTATMVSTKNDEVPLLQTSTNTLDLRGKRAEEAIGEMWKFVDASVLRGEQSIILLHGHGFGSLKEVIRKELSQQKFYQLTFAPGSHNIGGDGVTVVRFANL